TSPARSGASPTPARRKRACQTAGAPPSGGAPASRFQENVTMPIISRVISGWLPALGLAFAVTGPGVAADAVAGRDLAGRCRVCHGLDGVGTNPMVPSIG